jgi:hypothetical protein
LRRRALAALGALLALDIIACSYDFNAYDPIAGGDGGVDAGDASTGTRDAPPPPPGTDAPPPPPVDGGPPPPVDAACTAPASCFTAAQGCAATCASQYDQCVQNCSNAGCRQMCLQKEVTCGQHCANQCVGCTTQAGCTDNADCLDASTVD